jgi:hypothetical protein
MVVTPIWTMDNLILASQSPRWYQPKTAFMYYFIRHWIISTPDLPDMATGKPIG